MCEEDLQILAHIFYLMYNISSNRGNNELSNSQLIMQTGVSNGSENKISIT